MLKKIKLGISACLLGHKVRYNGSHKLNTFIAKILSKYFSWVLICPEVECGLGVPRPPLRLEGPYKPPRLIAFQSKTDHTDKLVNWSIQKLQKLKRQNLCGFIFKSKSPSCGLHKIKIYKNIFIWPFYTRGLFAQYFKNYFPHLPTIEDNQLKNKNILQGFIKQCIFIWHWNQHFNGKISFAKLISFQAKAKFLLMSCSPKQFKKIERLISHSKLFKKTQIVAEYLSLSLNTLKQKSSRKNNLKAVQKIYNYLKAYLPPQSNLALLKAIEKYKNNVYPLYRLKQILKKYSQMVKANNLSKQFYLNPHPAEQIYDKFF